MNKESCIKCSINFKDVLQEYKLILNIQYHINLNNKITTISISRNIDNRNKVLLNTTKLEFL